MGRIIVVALATDLFTYAHPAAAGQAPVIVVSAFRRAPRAA